MNGATCVAISVGNTRTQLGLFEDGKLVRSSRLANDDLDAVLSTARLMIEESGESEAVVALGSVNDRVADDLKGRIESTTTASVSRVGDDLAIPIGESLDPETLTGIDRLLNAAAAYDRLKQACVIVDAGTAVTVDFVDGEGVFQGGAIAPGVSMQLRSLHEGTEALPLIEAASPDPDAFGRNTRQAILNGVLYGLRGLVWKLVERYAEAYGAFPTVIATGGDAALLFEGDELVNRIVPDLTLMGIEVAVRQAIGGDASETDASAT